LHSTRTLSPIWLERIAICRRKMRSSLSPLAAAARGARPRNAGRRPAAGQPRVTRSSLAGATIHRWRPGHPRSHPEKRLRCLVAPPNRHSSYQGAFGGDRLSSNPVAARMTPKLEAAFSACREVVRRSSSNFACIDWLLPLDPRSGTEALYAFARRSDDIADSPEPLDDRRRRLAQGREELRAALAGRAEDPILVALADTVSRFVVPKHLLW